MQNVNINSEMKLDSSPQVCDSEYLPPEACPPNFLYSTSNTTISDAIAKAFKGFTNFIMTLRHNVELRGCGASSIYFIYFAFFLIYPELFERRGSRSPFERLVIFLVLLFLLIIFEKH